MFLFNSTSLTFTLAFGFICDWAEKLNNGLERKSSNGEESHREGGSVVELGDSYEGAEESSMEGEMDQSAGTKKKKSKLKLLGVVPIPGTKKEYKEDRREKKAEKRIQKQSRRPAWEAGVSTGKY